MTCYRCGCDLADQDREYLFEVDPTWKAPPPFVGMGPALKAKLTDRHRTADLCMIALRRKEIEP